MWFMREIVADKEICKKIYIQHSEIWNASVSLSTFHICFVRIFPEQWREVMRKTPNVSLGCFAGLGKI